MGYGSVDRLWALEHFISEVRKKCMSQTILEVGLGQVAARLEWGSSTGARTPYFERFEKSAWVKKF